MTIDEIRRQCWIEFNNEDQLSFVKSLKTKYIGVLKNTESFDDINRARQYSPPSSFYGHRYRKNIAVLSDCRPKVTMDLFVTDSDGFLMNNAKHESTYSRINNAKANGNLIISVFGGSTIEGMGAQRPEYTIPSLIEKILKHKYGTEAVIINHGIGGTSSVNSLNVLINEVLDYSPDIVIFYDGWNCCSYHSFMERFRMQKSQNIDIFPYKGTEVRHFEHDITLHQQYDITRLFWKLICLCVNKVSISMVIIIESIFNKWKRTPYFRRVVLVVLARFFSVRPHSIAEKIQNKNQSPEEVLLIAKKAVDNYIKTHDVASSICKSNKIKFFTFCQPLLLWGNNKILTDDEKKWQDSGYSSGNPKVFSEFYDKLINKSVDLDYFHDLSDSFKGVKDELYIDRGHLNKKGNFIISENIADSIMRDEL